MKKIFLANALLLSSLNLMASYVAGYQSCGHISGTGHTHFIVKGKGLGDKRYGRELAMSNFLNADYASETNKHCELHRVYGNQGGVTFSYRSKADANKKFAALINDAKRATYVKKIITISRGYDERDWR